MEKQVYRFGKFLWDRQAVAPDALLAGLNVQKERCLLIGEIALREGMLSGQQIFEILNNQLEVDKRFGEIAVDLGYLQEEDVQYLLKLQKERIPLLGELLVDMEQITIETRDQMLAEYHQFMNEHDEYIP